MVCIVPTIKLVSVLFWNKLDKISACNKIFLSGLAYIDVSINTIKLIKNVKIMLLKKVFFIRKNMLFKLTDLVNVLKQIFGLTKYMVFKLYVHKHINK